MNKFEIGHTAYYTLERQLDGSSIAEGDRMNPETEVIVDRAMRAILTFFREDEAPPCPGCPVSEGCELCAQCSKCSVMVTYGECLGGDCEHVPGEDFCWDRIKRDITHGGIDES